MVPPFSPSSARASNMDHFQRLHPPRVNPHLRQLLSFPFDYLPCLTALLPSLGPLLAFFVTDWQWIVQCSSLQYNCSSSSRTLNFSPDCSSPLSPPSSVKLQSHNLYLKPFSCSRFPMFFVFGFTPGSDFPFPPLAYSLQEFAPRSLKQSLFSLASIVRAPFDLRLSIDTGFFFEDWAPFPFPY